MPHPKGHVKLSGDTHLPDVEGDDELESGVSPTAGLALGRGVTGRAHRRAGLLSAEDREAAMSAGPAADSESSLAMASRAPVAWRSDAAAAPSWLVPAAMGLLGLWLVRRLLR